MKKYVRFSCSVCKRFIDELVDQSHYTSDKCTITLKCEGRLFPIQYLSNAQISTSPEVGIVDWRPRGTQESNAVRAAETVLLDTSTGTKSQVVLAVLATTDPAPGSTLAVTLNQRVDTPKANKQFVFRISGTFSTVSGVESGIEKKTLRYSLTDTVEVLLNGRKLELGTAPDQYQLYDGGISPVPPNTVSFNTPVSLSGTTQVDVIVSQTAPTTQVQLTFNRNINDESRLDTGSWENVDSIQIFNGTTWQTFYLFTLDLANATSLNLNTILTSESTAVLNGSIPIQSSNIRMLLARKPFSILDRYLNLSIPLSTLSFERDYLKYFAVNGEVVLYVTDTSVQTLYPLLRVNRFNTERTIKTALDGVQDQVLVDGSVIVGPDS